jgi:hypothetical protein
MAIRDSVSFYFAIFGCNLLSFLLVLPYFDLLEKPGIGGAMVGGLAMVIPFGIIAELLSTVRLSSLFEGSFSQQIARGVATQVVSIGIGILFTRILVGFVKTNSEWHLIPLVFVIAFGSIAIGNSIVRITTGRRQLPGSNAS